MSLSHDVTVSGTAPGRSAPTSKPHKGKASVDALRHRGFAGIPDMLLMEWSNRHRSKRGST